MTAGSRVAVLGLGNLLLKDDAIGLYLVRELEKKGPPPGVVCLEGGTGLWAVPALLRKRPALLAVDAVRGGGEPGSVYLLSQKDLFPEEGEGGSWLSLHDLRLPGLLQLPELAGRVRSWAIMGVEPQEIGPGVGLTPALQAQVAELTEALWQEAARMAGPIPQSPEFQRQ